MVQELISKAVSEVRSEAAKALSEALFKSEAKGAKDLSEVRSEAAKDISEVRSEAAKALSEVRSEAAKDLSEALFKSEAKGAKALSKVRSEVVHPIALRSLLDLAKVKLGVIRTSNPRHAAYERVANARHLGLYKTDVKVIFSSDDSSVRRSGNVAAHVVSDDDIRDAVVSHLSSNRKNGINLRRIFHFQFGYDAIIGSHPPL